MHSICFVGCLTARSSPLLFCVIFVRVCVCVCLGPVIRERYTLNWGLMEFRGWKDFLSKNSRCWHNKQTMNAYYFHRFCIEISRVYIQSQSNKHTNTGCMCFERFSGASPGHMHTSQVYIEHQQTIDSPAVQFFAMFLFLPRAGDKHIVIETERERVRQRGWEWVSIAAHVVHLVKIMPSYWLFTAKLIREMFMYS